VLELSKLKDYTVAAPDGEVGPVLDVLFDDEWVVRYLVVDPLGLERTDALVVSPMAVVSVAHDERELRIDLTRDRVARSPSLGSHEPVSAQKEREYYRYYGWQYYWEGRGLWGRLTTPAGLAAIPPAAAAEGPVDARSGELDQLDPRTGEILRIPEPRRGDDEPEPERGDDEREPERTLRSVEAVTGYHVRARDGEIGHVMEFVADEESWQIPCLVVDTSNWWFGKKVAVAHAHVTDMDWAERVVAVDLSRDEVKSGPEYDDARSCTDV
jgi:hypothetical protein